MTTEKDLLDQDIESEGIDVDDGNYAAVLYTLGNVREVKRSEQFRKEGQSETRTMMDAVFAVRVPAGDVTSVQWMLPVPEGGKIHIRSNTFKLLSTLANGDEKLITKEGKLGKGVKLRAFLNRTCCVETKKNKEGFPNVVGCSKPVDGLKFPTKKEIENLFGDDVPF